MTLETKKTLGTQAILIDAAKLIFVCEIHFLADFTGTKLNQYTQCISMSLVFISLLSPPPPPPPLSIHSSFIPFLFLLTQDLVYRGSMQSHLECARSIQPLIKYQVVEDPCSLKLCVPVSLLTFLLISLLFPTYSPLCRKSLGTQAALFVCESHYLSCT